MTRALLRSSATPLLRYRFGAPSAALRPGGRCSRLPHFVGEAKKGASHAF